MTPVTPYMTSFKAAHAKQSTGFCNQHVTRRLCILEIGLYHFQSKISSFSISQLNHNGEPAWLTWPQVTWVKDPIFTKCQSAGDLVRSGSFSFLRQRSWSWQRCKITPLFGRADVYILCHRSVTWPDMKMRQCRNVRLGSAELNFSSPFLTRSEQCRKKSGRWHQPPRPGWVKGNIPPSTRGFELSELFLALAYKTLFRSLYGPPRH